MNEFHKQYLQEWPVSNDYVFSREEVMRQLEAGAIDVDSAHYLLQLRYELRNGKVRIQSDKDAPNDYVEALVRNRKYRNPL